MHTLRRGSKHRRPPPLPHGFLLFTRHSWRFLQTLPTAERKTRTMKIDEKKKCLGPMILAAMDAARRDGGRGEKLKGFASTHSFTAGCAPLLVFHEHGETGESKQQQRRDDVRCKQKEKDCRRCYRRYTGTGKWRKIARLKSREHRQIRRRRRAGASGQPIRTPARRE